MGAEHTRIPLSYVESSGAKSSLYWYIAVIFPIRLRKFLIIEWLIHIQALILFDVDVDITDSASSTSGINLDQYVVFGLSVGVVTSEAMT